MSRAESKGRALAERDPGPMSNSVVAEHTEQGLRIVTVRGTLDLSSSIHLTPVDASVRAVLLDLRGVDFLSSAGIATLLRVRNDVPSRAPLVAVADHQEVVRPFELSGLDRLIPVVPDLEAGRRRVG
ncbi:STAS domain-containing protein [Rhodococcoides corynebacterioides]|uniref:STAS domain-containing protein n=2 Tax=Rhodococcoides corynebacterioides TaxID=53972 RepID=UPI003AE1A7D7